MWIERREESRDLAAIIYETVRERIGTDAHPLYNFGAVSKLVQVYKSLGQTDNAQQALLRAYDELDLASDSSTTVRLNNIESIAGGLFSIDACSLRRFVLGTFARASHLRP